MTTIPVLNALRLAAGLVALALLAGCFETKQEFTLNPDGSGKVVHESIFEPTGIPRDRRSADRKLNYAVAQIIEHAKGVDAWRDMSFELLKDGRVSFKGTAYFRNLSDLALPGQTILDFDWTRATDGTAALTARRKPMADPNAGSAPSPEKHSPAEMAQLFKETRARYPEAKGVLTLMMGSLKHEVVFHLPGNRGKTTVFQVEPAGTVRLQFGGDRFLAAVEKLMNDDAWLATHALDLDSYAFGGGGELDDHLSEPMFGEKGPMQAAVSGLGAAAFDYESEVALARKQSRTLQEQLTLGAGTVAPPAHGNTMKSLQVVGVRLVRAIDPSLEFRLHQSASYTLTLLAELPGGAHDISDESGLDSAVASDGSDLLPKRDFERRFLLPRLSADKASVLLEASLNAPGPGVTGIKELSGHLVYSVAGSIVETELDLPKVAAGAKGKALGAEIKSVGGKLDGGSRTIELQLDVEPELIKALYLVIGKERTELRQRDYRGGRGTYVFTFESAKEFPSESKLVTETYTEMQTYDTPFKLENITLLGEAVGAKP